MGYIETEKKRLMVRLGAMRGKCVDQGRNPNSSERAEARRLLKEIEILDWENEQSAEEPERTHVDTRKDKNNMKKRFNSFGEQLQAVITASSPEGRTDERLYRGITGLSETVPSDGGFAVQTDFSKEILKAAYGKSILAKKCKKIQISGPSSSLKISAIDETSRANGSRWGGIQSYWVNEGNEYTSSKPKMRQMELSLNKLTGLAYLTEELAMDAPALEAVVKDAFASEIGFVMDDMVLRGSGVGQPQG